VTIIQTGAARKNNAQPWSEENVMPNTYRGHWPAAVLLLVTLAALAATSPADEPPGTDGSYAALIVIHPAGTNTGKFARGRSDCRRYGVIWSGGAALRRPGRISPRPVRSRWQGGGESRIRCADGGAFEQRYVAEQPWIR
jgi:hypothetical protein